jgi:hypothetical protein
MNKKEKGDEELNQAQLQSVAGGAGTNPNESLSNEDLCKQYPNLGMRQVAVEQITQAAKDADMARYTDLSHKK